MKLDTLYLVETPEGTDLHAELAGLVPRALAYTIDCLLRVLLVLLCFGVTLFLGMTGLGIALIVCFLLEWWYPVFFEVYRDGQTIGKKMFNIKVVNADLTPVRLGPSLIRNLLRTVDFFPLYYATGIISILTTRHFQRLGDLAANTVVIYQEEEEYDGAVLEGVTPVAPTHAMNELQQGAFINFSLNQGRLSQARQNEIAEIVRPCLPVHTDNAVDYVRGIGKWLLGAK